MQIGALVHAGSLYQASLRPSPFNMIALCYGTYLFILLILHLAVISHKVDSTWQSRLGKNYQTIQEICKIFTRSQLSEFEKHTFQVLT